MSDTTTMTPMMWLSLLEEIDPGEQLRKEVLDVVSDLRDVVDRVRPLVAQARDVRERMSAIEDAALAALADAGVVDLAEMTDVEVGIRALLVGLLHTTDLFSVLYQLEELVHPEVVFIRPAAEGLGSDATP